MRRSVEMHRDGQAQDRLVQLEHTMKRGTQLESELWARQIGNIDPPTVLAMLRKIEDRGALEMAKRVKEHCSQIFRFALVSGRCSRDPTADLRGALQPSQPVKHHTVVRKGELPQLLRDIDAYHQIGEETTRLGLQLAMLTLVRTSELIKGEWTQIEGLDVSNGLQE